MTDGGSGRRGSETARAWATQIAEEFGRAVHFYRNRLGLSAVQLSNRCKEIGYPITRGTIAKIESNSRNAKMDVAEVLVLAAALEVAPIDLAFPGYPSKETRMVPKYITSAGEAADWFSASPDYQPFGRANSPRAEHSQQLRQAVERAEQGLRQARTFATDPNGEPSASMLSEERAIAILEDFISMKTQVESAGGKLAEPLWITQLRDMLSDPETSWTPF